MTLINPVNLLAGFASNASAHYVKRRRLRENAKVVRYLEEMPPYLRKDIGIAQGADLEALVGAGKAKPAGDWGCPDLMITPRGA